MSTENKDELEQQDKTIRKSLAMVFIPIFLILILLSIFQNNSKSYLEKQYKKIRNNAYAGTVTNLLPDNNNGRTRAILIDDKFEKKIPFSLYKKLTIGDSLYKEMDSDFEYYILKAKGDTIKRDVNDFYRKKYFDQLNEK
ncbi:hypothetical protein [Winogradskyella arenosi]|uniref:Uncharacterized protein n=1 Tax=Winogradskyella arenosi TaxID=533325 RepID=A0A368ZCZ6_9FLAO|nr:hypothetical protein [Winogradskyella arenosi]RCW90916.1 hypothetical protein DFQ08_104316 [Winogradskyella arenosi]